ncbi:MAG: B12-binding domain-containing radical SAM protein [Acidobacteriia bacterium]|nr:B12-binding domain-containing radical SAM protein [Terriglobia bacterium]
MKVLVLNPVSRVSKNVIRDVLYGCWCSGKRIGGGTVPPFGLLQVATVLRNDGQDVTFLDAQAEQLSHDQVNNMARGMDTVVISTSTMTFLEDANMLLGLKETNPGLKTLAFGSHPTFMPKYTLAHKGVDIAVRHEPEFITRDLHREMRTGGEWKQVAGIAFVENGGVRINPDYPLYDLNELPFPDVTMLPKGIHYFNPLVRRLPYITTTTSKGCPAKCTFCTAPYFDGMRTRFQLADYVVREIEYFLQQGYREVYFRDDTFFVHKKRDTEICRQILERKLDVSWIANARVSMIDKEMMELARAAGCHTLKLGVESGVQEILDRARKGYKVEQAYDVFRWAKEVGLHTHAHVMVGMPGDNQETVNRTIQFVKELNPTTATFGACTPYPGTPLFDEVAAAHPEIQDGSASSLHKLHVEGIFNEIYADLTKEQLKKSIRRAYREFYLRPSYFCDSLRQLHGVDDVKRLSIAATNVLDFALFGG